MLVLAPLLVQASLAVVAAIPAIIAHEKLVLEPYKDIADVDTYCLGETQNVEQRPYTELECLALAVERLSKDFERPIMECTPNWHELPLETQMATLTFTYNIGTNGYCRSSTRKAFIAGDLATGCDKMLLWNKARVKGVLREVRGLTNRRMAERSLCLSGLS